MGFMEFNGFFYGFIGVVLSGYCYCKGCCKDSIRFVYQASIGVAIGP